MCDRLWSEEAMAELEKLLVGHIGKYLQPIYEVEYTVWVECQPDG